MGRWKDYYQKLDEKQSKAKEAESVKNYNNEVDLFNKLAPDFKHMIETTSTPPKDNYLWVMKKMETEVCWPIVDLTTEEHSSRICVLENGTIVKVKWDQCYSDYYNCYMYIEDLEVPYVTGAYKNCHDEIEFYPHSAIEFNKLKELNDSIKEMLGH